VVMLWGAVTSNPGVAPVRQVEGATVVLGPRAGDWTIALGRGVLSSNEVDACWKVLRDQAARRDTGEEALPPSVARMAFTAWGAFLAAAAGMLAALNVARLPVPWPAWAALDGLIFFAPMVLAAILRLPRLPRIGWQTGAGLGTLFLLAVVALGA